MKKLILIGLIVTGISGVAYASYQEKACNGSAKFIENLNLDQARSTEVQTILKSYTQVKDMAKSGQFDQIERFIENKNAELESALTAEEFALFKKNVGRWADEKDFSMFMEFGGEHFSKHK